MAWTEVGGQGGGSGFSNPIQKWTQAGQTVEGVYKGQREGKFGPLMIVDTAQGEVVYGSKAVLARKLKEVRPGWRVRITYLGKRRSASGTEYGDFSVQYDDTGMSAPITRSSPLIPATPVDMVEFDRLVGLIRADKGDGIANALKAAAMATTNPIGSLRDAMGQIGVVPF